MNHHGCVYRGYVERRLKERGQSIKVEVEVLGLELHKKLAELGLVSPCYRKDSSAGKRYRYLNPILQARNIRALIELKQVGKRGETFAGVQIGATQFEFLNQWV